MEFYFVETTFICGINFLLLFRQPCIQFGLQATRPLKDYPPNINNTRRLLYTLNLSNVSKYNDFWCTYHVWDLDPKTLPVIHVTPHYKERNLYSSKKITNKSKNIFKFVTGSAWTPMSVQCANIVNISSSCISRRISEQSSTIHSDSLHTNNNWTAWKF